MKWKGTGEVMARKSFQWKSAFQVVFVWWFAVELLQARAANILVSAGFGEGSHYLVAEAVAKSLVSRGHNITFLISNAHAYRSEDETASRLFNFIIFNHSIPVAVLERNLDFFSDMAFESVSFEMLKVINFVGAVGKQDCDAILSDQQMIRHLKERKFAAVIYDQIWMCGHVISQLLGTQTIISHPTMMGSLALNRAGTSINPSYMPESMTGIARTMSFGGRLKNTLFMYFAYGMSVFYFRPFEELKRKHLVTPDTSLWRALSEADLWLVNTDVPLDYPMPTTPKLVRCGGLTARPAQPLPEDLEDFIQSSGDNGVVLFTLGTYLTSLKPKIIETFIDAFREIPQKVIWQLRATPSVPLPDNVWTMPWVPQNDILGHPKTKVFMYQGGNNGQFEALYHAVPTVVIPCFADQYDVAARLVDSGMGISLDKLNLNSDAIANALLMVIHNSTYSASAKRLSAIFRDKPMNPADKAAFWVDHVIKHGSRHFQSPEKEFGVIKFYLIDVHAFLFLVATIILYILYIIIRIIRQLFVDIFSMFIKVKYE